MIKVSIITINYNNKSGLERTILSVINQNYTDFEFIIIDGNSNDGSLDIIHKYSKFITYWVSEPDKGIYNAMNKGVKQAKGEYCNFMNSGDCFIGNNVLKDIFSKPQTEDILIGKAQTLNRIIPPPIYPDLAFFVNHKPINHQAAFIKRYLLIKFPYEEIKYKIVSDYNFFFEAFIIDNASYKSLKFDIVLFEQGGIGSTDIERNRKEQNQIIENYFPKRAVESFIYFKFADNNKYLTLCNNFMNYTKRILGKLIKH